MGKRPQRTSGSAAEQVAIMLPVPQHPNLVAPKRSGDREHHAMRGAEACFCDAALDETGGAVKPQRVRI